MALFDIRNLFSMNRYEALAISTVTLAAVLGIRRFVKEYSVIISGIVIFAAMVVSEYRMNVLSVLKGVFTLSKYEVSILAGMAVGAYYGGRHLYNMVQKTWTERKLRKFSKTPRDLVILHGFSRPREIPNISPYVFKVEVFLRMAKIKYEYDSTEPFGPDGKAPWISMNGEHIADSDFIIDHLLKKFEKDLTQRYSAEQLAVAQCVKLVLEEHALWGLSLEKFVYNKAALIDTGMHVSFLSRLYLQHAIRTRSEAQGMGQHTPDQVHKLVKSDLRAVSAILGENHFIVGDRPCVYDCGIFAVLSQVIWGQPDSPYKKLVNEECKNLEDYCMRMKERFFPDWNDLLAKD